MKGFRLKVFQMFMPHDVRGVYGRDVTLERFAALGGAANLFGDRMIAGMDYRPHNNDLLRAFFSGFDGEKLFIGNAPTPVTAFLSKQFGLSITASHNPAEYAGAKFFKERTYVTEEEMAALKGRFEENGVECLTAGITTTAANPMVVDPAQVNEYIDSLPEFEGGIFDLAGGAACALQHVFPSTIFSDPDPFFVNHSPEPKNDTLVSLKEKTRRGSLGFAFDGDADRVIVCDCGAVLEGDIVAAFIAKRFLKRRDCIVLSIDCRQEVFDLLKDSFRVVASKVGDPNVLRTALEEGAKFSAERSGHYSFLNHAPNSDGIYASAVLSSTSPGELAAFSKQFRNVTCIEQLFERIDFGKLKGLIEEKRPRELVTLDGVKAVFDDYTILVRASTTELKVRINCEAKNTELAKKGMALAKDLVAKCIVKKLGGH